MNDRIKTSLPIFDDSAQEPIDDAQIEEHLKAYEDAELERRELRKERDHWRDNMIDPQFKKSERAKVTLLISGLTKAQDFLVEGALRGVGYNVETIDCPDQSALQVGKEYGNRAQCNPTYFTVGNLVQKLIQLRDEEGISTEDIIKHYIFLTAGACGPCRFGMYATEYRKALRDAGFDGFRVMLFQQQGGLDQATGEEEGLELNPEFFIAIVKAIVCGDVLNALAYRIRPYEVKRGATNQAIVDAKKILYRALFEKKNIFGALVRCRKLFSSIEIDPLQVRPKVSIIGEFWAMTTEGDGNYHLQHFLESEGAECDIQLTTAWLLYNIWEVARDTRERDTLRIADDHGAGLKEFEGEFDVAQRQATLKAAEWGLRLGFQAFAMPPGLHGYHLPDMDAVAEVADDHYSNDLRGGEGHMEVGKLILNVVKNKATMTLSVKPFGCMPSSGVSDGVQSLITNKYPGTIYCAVETSGDGATNFYSRVQMYLYKARIAAEQEVERAYEEHGVTEAEVRAFLEQNPEFKSALHHAPHVYASSAANLIAEVAPLIGTTEAERTKKAVTETAQWAAGQLAKVPGLAKQAITAVADPQVREMLAVDAELAVDLVRGKARERYAPLVKRLMGDAYWKNNDEAPRVDAEPMAAE